MRIQNQGLDHVEFIVQNLPKHASMYERMGFECVGERNLPQRGLRSVLYAQGYARIMLTQADGSHASQKENCTQFLNEHGEGVCVLALDVDDARQSFTEAVARGARPALEPVQYASPQGTVVRAEIWTPEDIRYAFIERKVTGNPKGPALFDEGLVAARMESPAPLGIRVIDHLTNNVDMKQMKVWTDWYQKVFGFSIVRHFEISTGRTGLISDVVQSPEGKIKVPVNEATEPESQVQEFVTRFKGAGVQHLAFLTTDIIGLLKTLRSREYKFLSAPHTYYEAIPGRVKGVKEDLGLLENLGILVDGDETGYLLQIFTEEMVGPFFFEYIERKGNQGFGEGNFRALFEAIERDQIKRGVLKSNA